MDNMTAPQKWSQNILIASWRPAIINACNTQDSQRDQAFKIIPQRSEDCL